MARQFDVQYIRSYTDGTAARKLDVPTPQKAVRRTAAVKRKKIVIHIDPVAIMGITMAVVMMVLMAAGFTKLLDAQNEMVQMEAYVQTLQQENERLQQEYDAGYDLENVRQTALALGMVPMEDVSQVSIRVSVPHEPQPSGWEQFCTFLSGLFA